MLLLCVCVYACCCCWTKCTNLVTCFRWHCVVLWSKPFIYISYKNTRAMCDTFHQMATHFQFEPYLKRCTLASHHDNINFQTDAPHSTIILILYVYVHAEIHFGLSLSPLYSMNWMVSFFMSLSLSFARFRCHITKYRLFSVHFYSHYAYCGCSLCLFQFNDRHSLAQVLYSKLFILTLNFADTVKRQYIRLSIKLNEMKQTHTHRCIAAVRSIFEYIAQWMEILWCFSSCFVFCLFFIFDFSKRTFSSPFWPNS